MTLKDILVLLEIPFTKKKKKAKPEVLKHIRNSTGLLFLDVATKLGEKCLLLSVLTVTGKHKVICMSKVFCF